MLPSTRHNYHGHTLVEMMITVSIFSLVGIFVAYLSLELGYQFRQSINQSPAQEQAMRTMNFVRTRLLSADSSSMSISNNARTITFNDPSLRTTSSINFNDATGEVEYDPDIATGGNTRTWGRRIDGNFQTSTASPSEISVTILTETIDRKNEPLLYSYVDQVRVRN